MTLAQVKALRDKYYQALLDYPAIAEDHSISDASYSHDGHRENLQKQFEFWDKLYNVKSGAAQGARLGTKAV